MKKLNILPAIILLIIYVSVQAADLPMQFDTPEQEQRYQDLIEELRCLVCQNQNLADSHAGLAQDLREEVHEMIMAGNSDDEILSFLTARYGDFVLYRPPVKGSTWLLWFGPFILLLAGLVIVFRFVRKREQAQQTELSDTERQQLDKLLREENGKS